MSTTERLQEKIAQLKQVRERMVAQREQLTANIHAQDGAIQMCELLLKEEISEEQPTKEKEA